MQLAALLRFTYWLTQVGCSTPVVMVFAWGWGLSCNSCPVPPLVFLFCACAASPSAASSSEFCPLTEWVSMSVSSLLVYSSGWVGGVWLRPLPQGLQRALFSLGVVFWAYPALLACGVSGLCTLCQVLQLRCCLLALQVGFPCCLFFTLEWVCFWLRCLQSLWAAKAVSAALRGSSSTSCVCWSFTIFWSWGGFWSQVGGPSCDSWFWTLLMLGYTSWRLSLCLYSHLWQLDGPGACLFLRFALGSSSRFLCWLLACGDCGFSLVVLPP